MSYFAGFSAVPKFAQAVTLDPSSVPANAVATETFTVKGLRTFMLPLVSAPALEAGLTLIQSRITAADTLELTFQNNTGAAINAASQSFQVMGL